MKILVLEDQASDFIMIRNVLNQYDFEVIHAPNSRQVFNILETQEPDLLLFDIELEREAIEDIERNGHITGISVAKEVLSNYSFPIVFLTQYYDNKKYFKDVQKLEIPAKYFLSKKNLMENEAVFIKTLEAAIEDFNKVDSITIDHYQALSNRKIGIRKGSGQNYTFYNKDEIIYIKAKDQLVYFHFEDRSSLNMATSLKRIMDQIKPVYFNFLKLDRNYSINVEKIKAINGNTLYFDNGTQIPLSPAARLKLKKENLIIRTRPKN